MVKGYQRSSGAMPRIVVSFDQDTFDHIRRRSERAQTSFAEEIRLLATIGIETMENAHA